MIKNVFSDFRDKVNLKAQDLSYEFIKKVNNILNLPMLVWMPDDLKDYEDGSIGMVYWDLLVEMIIYPDSNKREYSFRTQIHTQFEKEEEIPLDKFRKLLDHTMIATHVDSTASLSESFELLGQNEIPKMLDLKSSGEEQKEEARLFQEKLIEAKKIADEHIKREKEKWVSMGCMCSTFHRWPDCPIHGEGADK